MWITLFFVSCTSLLVKGFGNVEMLGKGQWYVVNVLQCEEPEQYEVPLEITRKKINRTHDAFSIHGNLKREFNVTYGIEIIANKEVDGGYKFFTQITDMSFCKMAKKYLGNNWEDILTNAKVDPPDCPVPAGEFKLDEYVIDFRQVKETAVYGKYEVHVYYTYTGRRVACIRFLAQFEKQREDDDDDDEDY